ncbi:hypothetical protein GMDG_00016 [Pseudogymnoascus destructans 20631-21]|uniref:Autophagy-related protein 27 n=1 Tax=Pseudogymnoascus destructans (strain ATCC MYA-4855 / 20631-21) TaxID=658429 RepID=L8FL92_PSED2|nr:hypothetical protein GMDG_00016 [Pseudogymnoascus destructans 20631-21]
MHIPHRPSSITMPTLLSLLLPLLLPLSAAALGTIDCSKMLADKHNFDLSALDGPHSVMHGVEQPPSFLNTTYTINICRPLVPDSDVKKEERCPGPTRAPNQRKTTTISRVIPIAGDLQNFPGGTLLDASYTRLRTAPSPADQAREGIRVELHGGSYNGRKQKAVVEFLCDPEVEGTEEEEGEEGVLDVYRRKEEGGNSTTRATKALVFKKYGPEGAKGEVDVLTLEWWTKYACESVEGGGGKEKGSWGFFTWFIIIAFLSTAAYLIFGSWLNYNRYGARGWDLLPHGDTIRDVPYLVKDWSRRVFNTVQDSGSRGGYSAV